MPSTPLDVASQLFGAIESKSVSSVAALYDEAVEVWHNFDNAIQTKTANLKVLEGLTKTVDKLRYEVIERLHVGDRVIQRHELHCTMRNGRTFVIPCSIFLTVKNGKITRIDEYLDTAQVAALRG